MPDNLAPAQSLSIGQILSGQTQFNFPFYQRKYVWSDNEILQLIGDIDLSLEDMVERKNGGHEAGSLSTYFLGSLVSIAGKNRAKGAPVDIVDGQQRIITLSMLDLALDLAIKNRWFQEPGDNEHPEDEENGLSPDLDACPPELRKLLQQRFPTTDFNLPPEENGSSNGVEQDDLDHNADGNAILKGWQSILRGIEGLGADRLEDFRSYVAQNCWAVQIKAPDEADGHQIFINLNVKGRRLDDSDEYRAEVLGNIADKKRRRELTQAWDGWKRELGTGFDGRSGLFAQIAYLSTASPKSIALQIRTLYQARGGESFMDEIFLPCAAAYQTLRTPQVKAGLMKRKARANERKVVHLIRLLNLVPNADWMHVAMAWLLCNGNRIDDDQSVAFFTALERLTHLILLRKIIGANGRRAFRPVVEALPVFQEQATPAQRKAAIMAMKNGNGKHYAQALKNGGQLYKLGTDIARLILYRLHLHATGDKDPVGRDDIRSFSVEHVLPKGKRLPRDTGWHDSFPDKQQRLRLANCTGNLALISRTQNSRAGHDGFTVKKKIYEASGPGYMKPIPWAEDFKVADWERSHILARYQRMMEGIKELWDIRHTTPRYRH